MFFSANSWPTPLPISSLVTYPPPFTLFTTMTTWIYLHNKIKLTFLSAFLYCVFLPLSSNLCTSKKVIYFVVCSSWEVVVLYRAETLSLGKRLWILFLSFSICMILCVLLGLCELLLPLFFFFGPLCRDPLVLQPGVKPVPLVLDAQSLNHWTAREVQLPHLKLRIIASTLQTCCEDYMRSWCKILRTQ